MNILKPELRQAVFILKILKKPALIQAGFFVAMYWLLNTDP